MQQVEALQRQVQDKQQAAAQVCNAAHTLHHSAVTRALQLEAVVQEQQLQLDEADRRHQLFVKRARFVSLAGGTSRSDACYACSAAHADAMEEAAAHNALQLQAKDDRVQEVSTRTLACYALCV